MKASISAGRSTRANPASNTSFATLTAVLISTSRIFDWGGNSIPSLSCPGVTWSAAGVGHTDEPVEVGNQPCQAERLALGLSKCRGLVEDRIMQNIHSAFCGASFYHGNF